MHVPVVNRASVVPDTVHTDGGDDENATVRPLDAIADSVYGVCRRVSEAGALNRTDWLTFVTEIDFVTDDDA